MSACLAVLVLGASLQNASPAVVSYAGVLNNDSNSEATRWRSAGTAKTMDVDSNNIYGSLGAVVWGDGNNTANHSTPDMFISGTNAAGTFGWTLVAQTVNPDIGLGTQSFVHSQYTPMDNNLAGSAQIVHGVTSISSGNGTVTFRLNGASGDYTGRTVRLGLIQDYQEPTAVNDVSKRFTVVQTAGPGGGSNSIVRPATRNGTPKIYFFGLTGVVPGDEFTVTGYTNPATTASGGLASIGTMFLDISGGGPTNPPAIASPLSVAPTNVLMAGVTSPNGFALAVTTLGVTNAGGGVGITNGNITYTPPPNFVGLDSFQYTVSDGYGSAATGSVTIAVGDAGTHFNHVQITPAGQQFVISFHGVPLHDFVFEGTGNLTTGVWSAIQTNTLDGSGSLQLPPNYGGSMAMLFRFRGF